MTQISQIVSFLKVVMIDAKRVNVYNIRIGSKAFNKVYNESSSHNA